MDAWQADSGVEAEAAQVGAWFALADRCIERGFGSPGCYAEAGMFVLDEVGRDPRDADPDDFHGTGAIGGVIAKGYEQTLAGLGSPVAELTRIPDLMASRPEPWIE